ncbi:N-acetyltransferase [Roseobacter denitrificans]|uniref:Acetyltransferase, putative n=1 Tax=Roseobacter denitrificans (strain ATCC 33942 / OCh 114) TaxID=375451 RepID=Q164P3_ROSDO|nr:GNAT family N-acetyltransferase [Roseobacter denitrificans]ABG32550.1 acetyltransferase, putative [Roseobacter denitrificans OCh 114]AVL51996.1 N-acetyltransferase [Roseobacter denitrificans]SFF83442.1 Protein N-acetyltransferase, RimJ/RimL family [Roseobacter denitrificans OCh 114]
MSRTIPTINTHRLTLRGMRAEDFNRFAEIWAMPEVVRYIDGEPWPRGKAWDAFLKHAGHWQITGFGQWAILRHRAPDMSGQVGFFYGKRGLGPDFDDTPEAGWALAPDAHGQGYAKEAVRAAHDWFDRVVTGRLVCMIDPRNERALRLAAAMGYTLMREARYQGNPVRLFERKTPPQ